jgi:hypothetical protein
MLSFTVRNTYLLINYGDFVQGGFNTAPPYVQLLPTTNDTSGTHSDFVKVRLKGVDNGRKASTPSNSSKDKSESSLTRRTTFYIVIAAIGAGLVLLTLLGVYCYRRRRVTKVYQASTYAPLGYPAPQGDIPPYSSPHSAYYPPQTATYQTPYDRR